MNKQTYRRYTDKQFVGKELIALEDLHNSVFAMRKGAKMTIVRKYDGFEVKGKICPCCNIAVYMSKIPYEKVDLVNPELLEVKE